MIKILAQILLLLLISSLVAFGQSAPAQILSDADARIAADTYHQYQSALEAWQKLKSSLKSRYHLDWEEIDFSNDFKVMVPKSQAPQPTTPGFWIPANGGSGSGTVTFIPNSANLTIATPAPDAFLRGDGTWSSPPVFWDGTKSLKAPKSTQDDKGNLTLRK